MPTSSKKPKRPMRAADGVPLRVPLTAAQLAALADHPEPSAKSLRKVPPLDIGNAMTFGRGHDALRAGFEYLRAKRGRPKKGEQAVGTKSRSLKLSNVEWSLLEQRAKRQRTTVHALLRRAVARELAEAEPAPMPSTRRKRKTG
jgi:hypothetical protein